MFKDKLMTIKKKGEQFSDGFGKGVADTVKPNLVNVASAGMAFGFHYYKTKDYKVAGMKTLKGIATSAAITGLDYGIVNAATDGEYEEGITGILIDKFTQTGDPEPVDFKVFGNIEED